MNISSIPTPKTRKGRVPINATKYSPPAMIIPKELPIPSDTVIIPMFPRKIQRKTELYQKTTSPKISRKMVFVKSGFSKVAYQQLIRERKSLAP